MNFIPTDLSGAFILEIEPIEDKRGFFSRVFCRDEFEEHDIAPNFVQASISHNVVAGTLRGLHFQWPPSREAKLVRAERGRVYDVIVDLRPESPTFTRHLAVELDAEMRNALYVPPGFAHGYQTLEANSDLLYMMSDYYQPELGGGVRHDDPLLGIEWPIPIACISDADMDHPDFDSSDYCRRYGRLSGLVPE